MPADPRDQLIRYQSPFGIASVLDPPDSGYDPGFTPPQVQNLDMSPPAPPAPPTSAQAAASLAKVPLSAGSSVPKKFKAPKMPPPEAASAPPPEPIGTMDQTPAGVDQPAPAAAAPAATTSPTEKLRQLTESPLGQEATQAPKSNWAQRLALSILSATRLAPVANQIIHPKWSAQRGAFEQAEGDIAQQAKIQEAEQNIQGLAEQRQATAEERQAHADQRRAMADPHYGKVPVDPSYAPALVPEADGKVWVDKNVAAQLAKPDREAKPTIVPAGSTVIDSDGKVIYTAPDKPDKGPKALGDETRVAAVAAGVDPSKPPEEWTPDEAKRVEQQIEKHRQAIHVSVSAPGMTANDPKDIADAIVRGDQPPNLQGLYRIGAPVRAELGRRGYDLMTAQRDWQAIQKHLATLNGQQQERLRQAISFTSESLPMIEDLYGKWKATGLPNGFKDWNKAALIAASHLPGEAGSVANNLIAQINDLSSEMGTVYKGGNSSTDEGLRLAATNLQADWNEKTFRDAIQRLKQNLQIRRNSINSSEPMGVSPNSPYLPPQTSTAPPSGNRKPLDQIFK